MTIEDLVSLVRSSCVDEVTNGYAQCFDDHPIHGFTDTDMHQLAEAWKASDPTHRELLKAFVRLGAQNATAAMLRLLDEDNGLNDPELQLSAKTREGQVVNLRRDLLSTFWEQEELAGRVNKARR